MRRERMKQIVIWDKTCVRNKHQITLNDIGLKSVLQIWTLSPNIGFERIIIA